MVEKKIKSEKKTRPSDVFDENFINEICYRLEADMSQLQIAKEFNISDSLLSEWINAQPGRIARVRASRAKAADACDTKAEDVLLNLTPDATAAEVARARELANHYRWRAKVRNPQQYGDKQQVEHSGGMTLEQLVLASIQPVQPLSGGSTSSILPPPAKKDPTDGK